MILIQTKDGMVCLPRHQLSEYLPKIIRTGRRVAIISE